MGVIRKIVLSLLLVATLAHGQLSVDLNRAPAPLQHQSKIKQQSGNIETIYVSPEGRSPHLLYKQNSKQTNNRRNTHLRRKGDNDDEFKSVGFLGFLDGTFYVFQTIMMLLFGLFLSGAAIAVIG